MLDQLRFWGAPPEVLAEEAQRAAQVAAQAVVQVWPENWHAVCAFAAMGTQWNWAGGWLVEPQRVGLRLEALPVVLSAIRDEIKPSLRNSRGTLLRQLQVMEDAALRELLRMASKR